jgi:hypothetical protein
MTSARSVILLTPFYVVACSRIWCALSNFFPSDGRVSRAFRNNFRWFCQVPASESGGYGFVVDKDILVGHIYIRTLVVENNNHN